MSTQSQATACMAYTQRPLVHNSAPGRHKSNDMRLVQLGWIPTDEKETPLSCQRSAGLNLEEARDVLFGRENGLCTFKREGELEACSNLALDIQIALELMT